ncbi:MAG: hypothetical protein JWO36_4087 [Myxococcales bacterium]|nr:hypothetical protein [Myxococcales bacterium]
MRPLLLPIVIASTTAHAEPAPDLATPMRDSTSVTIAATREATQYQPSQGLRVELNVLELYGWTFGGALSLAQGKLGIYDGSQTALLHTTDTKATAYIARSARFAHWNLAGLVGAGAIHTSASGDMIDHSTMQPVHDSRLFPTVEASVRATVPISAHWSVTGGPMLTYLHQTFQFYNAGPNGPTHRDGELMLLLGLSYRL